MKIIFVHIIPAVKTGHGIVDRVIAVRQLAAVLVVEDEAALFQTDPGGVIDRGVDLGIGSGQLGHGFHRDRGGGGPVGPLGPGCDHEEQDRGQGQGQGQQPCGDIP